MGGWCDDPDNCIAKRLLKMAKPQIDWRYLLQESILFLLLGYLILFGGTFNGLVLLPLNQANLILVFVIGAGWLLWRWRGRRPFPRTALDLPILLVLAAYAIATLTSIDPRRSAVMLVQLVLYALAFYLLVDLLRAGLPSELLVKVLLLSSLVMVLFDLVQLGAWYAGWLSIGGLSHPIPPVTLRISAFLGHPNFVAAYFNLLLPLALGRAFQSRSRAVRFGWLAYALVAVILVFFTSSRGGWLGTAAALGFGLVLLAFDRRHALKAWWGGFHRRGVLLAMGILAAVALLAAGTVLLAWQSRHPSHASSGLNPQSRTYIWTVALDMFRAHPLSGNGPFTFGTEFIRHYSIPPAMLLAHAHNVVFNTASETGLLGGAALLALIAALAWLAWRRFQDTQGSERLGVVALAASLTGLMVHSLFDTPGLLPAITFVAVSLVALLAAGTNPSPAGSRIDRAGNISMTVAWLGIVGALAWQVWSYLPYVEGVAAANRVDFQAAAASLDEAARRDPALALNWFQAGFAHGRLALSSSSQSAQSVGQPDLALALADYQRGMALEPFYPTNRANLALLEWAAGQQGAALADMRIAAEGAGSQPAFRLTLGRMLEDCGQSERARQEYLAVLKQSPGWASSYFFRATSLRRDVVAGLGAQLGGDAARAEAVQDEYALKLATFNQVTGDDVVQNQLAWGRFYSQRGTLQAAIQAYEKALSTLNATSSFGVGRMGTSDYSYYVFYRDAIAADLLPGMDYILYTDDVVQGMLDLAYSYERLGDRSAAVRTYDRILLVSPDSAIARERKALVQP